MRLLGIALLGLGVLAMIFGGLHYNRQRSTVDLVPIEAATTESGNVPLAPIVGAIGMACGIGLLVYPKKRAT